VARLMARTSKWIGGLLLGLALALPAAAKEANRDQAFQRTALQVWGLNPFGTAEACFSPVSLWYALGLIEAGSGPPTSDDFYRFFSLTKTHYRENLEAWAATCWKPAGGPVAFDGGGLDSISGGFTAAGLPGSRPGFRGRSQGRRFHSPPRSLPAHRRVGVRQDRP